MGNEFVTYEQALALKELGFNESCFGCYQLSELRDYKKGLEVSWIMTLNTLNGYRIYEDETQTSAPLKQQVFRWFRERYKLVHEIQFGDGKIWVRYGYNSYVRALEVDTNNNEFFHTYEEAENACIDKLIEIAKQQVIS